MLRPWWFTEYNPSEQAIFDKLKIIIEKKYTSFGYTHIYTPAVESNKVLLAKSGQETSKQIFWLYGLAQGAEDLKEYSLHFDLTIPFARYILDHDQEITFPFKRYQIQPVRRGERAQRGRFREFWQCDIDTVWRADSTSSMIFYDAETLLVIADVFDEIKAKLNLWSITVHYNDRKFLANLLDHYPNKSDLYSLFDRYYKIGKETFDKELVQLVGEKEATNLKDQINNPNKNPELIELEWYISKLNTKNLKIVFDPFITRWLDYYTGMVFETFFDDDMALGSISSGGRYENLTTYIDPKRNFSGVGWSIGISRLVSLILEQETEKIQSTSQYLCIHFSETLDETCNIANQLRSQWHNVEVYPAPDKLGKQFWYADKKNIPYVVILGEGEKTEWIYKIKNMKTGEETSKSI
jgi:histidyl-tRNA synthetase